MQPDGSVKYSKRGGFQSEAEAEASYYKYEEECKKASGVYQMSAKPNAGAAKCAYGVPQIRDQWGKIFGRKLYQPHLKSGTPVREST